MPIYEVKNRKYPNGPYTGEQEWALRSMLAYNAQDDGKVYKVGRLNDIGVYYVYHTEDKAENIVYLID